MFLSRIIVPTDDKTLCVLRYLLLASNDYFNQREKLAIAALLCPRLEHFEVLIKQMLLPECLRSYHDFETMMMLKDHDPKLVVRSLHANLDLTRYGLMDVQESTRTMDSVQSMLQGLCIYLQVFFEAEEYVGPDERLAFCSAMNQYMRQKFLDPEYGLDFVVPEAGEGV